MKFFILEVCLWPNDPAKAARRLSFKPGALNVLTGRSRTGKSTVTWIIDYCLASTKCQIPVGVVRDTTSWFGVRVQLDSLQLVLARRCPEASKRASGDMYIAEGGVVELPARPPQHVTNVTDVKRRLDQLFTLSFLRLDDATARASFRDTMAFCFQPQHLMASPYSLFFRADRAEYADRLRKTFPYFLGTETEDDILRRYRIEKISAELRFLDREISAVSADESRDKQTAIGLISRAAELGVLDQDQADIDAEKTTLSACLDILEAAADGIRTKYPRVPGSTLAAEESRLTKLIREHDEVAKRARGLRSNLDRLRLFGDEIAQYNQEVSEGAQRSQQIGWFAKKIRGAQACPFCGDSNDSASKRLQALEANAVMAARVSEFSNATKPVLNEETRRIQEQLRSETEKLEGLRTRIEQLQEWKQIQGRIFEAYRFAGQIDFWVSSRRSIGGEGGLLNKRRRLDEELKELNEQLSDSARQQRHQRAMQTVAEGIAWRASRLRLERAADNPRLSISDLTVHFGRDKHYDTLSEIGSGANHMGYHLATLMSLHKYFIFEETPSVPQFLILDQPTQVYFPEKWPEELDSSLDDIAELSSRLDQYENDILSVRLLFSELANFVTEMSARIQIIVLDHAGAVAWEGIPGVNVVDTWRQNDEGLVPADWLS